MLDMARISTTGQVTIPAAVRKSLGLKEGDKVVFARQGDNIVLLNSNRLAFKEFQAGMAGEAERVGWTNEQDVVDFCKEIRATRRKFEEITKDMTAAERTAHFNDRGEITAQKYGFKVAEKVIVHTAV